MAEPKTFEEIYAEQIRERMAAGLTRDQSIAVQKAQNDWDKEQERKAAAEAAKAAKAAKAKE